MLTKAEKPLLSGLSGGGGPTPEPTLTYRRDLPVGDIPGEGDLHPDEQLLLDVSKREQELQAIKAQQVIRSSPDMGLTLIVMNPG